MQHRDIQCKWRSATLSAGKLVEKHVFGMKPIPDSIQTMLAYCSFATLSSYSTSSKSHSVSSARHISNRKYDEKQWILVHNFSDVYRVWCGSFDDCVRYRIIYYWKLCSTKFISDFLYAIHFELWNIESVFHSTKTR